MLLRTRLLAPTALLIAVLLAPGAVHAQSADDLRADLSSPDATTRAMAACRLGRMDRSAVEPARGLLVAMLGDATAVDPKLCRDWGRWGSDNQEPSSPGREAAIALEELGEAVLPDLVEALGLGDAARREHAALAIGLIESQRGIEPLTGAIDDPVPTVRARAAWGLGMIESERGIDALSRALRDDSSEVREQAAWGLGMIESVRAVDALLPALDDREVAVRREAAWALGMIESSTATEALLDRLDDPAASVRREVAWALGMIEDGRAASALADALEREQDDSVRKELLWALMQVADAADADLDWGRLASTLRRALLDG